jgi:hypothetical protein
LLAIARSIADPNYHCRALFQVAGAVAAADPDHAALLATEAETAARSFKDSSGAVSLVEVAEAVAAVDPERGEAIARTVVVRIPPGLTTKYATIWQRDADGRWRLAGDSSSPNPRSGWMSQPTVSR